MPIDTCQTPLESGNLTSMYLRIRWYGHKPINIIETATTEVAC